VLVFSESGFTVEVKNADASAPVCSFCMPRRQSPRKFLRVALTQLAGR
jgi:hypothetical protein